jgi:putative ATPase
MIILASEDVGLADPLALSVVISCAEAFNRIGFPEGNFPLAHACLYLATAPKSNTTMAFLDALGEVEREDAEVPNHLRDANRDGESFGHGGGYIYPHAYRDHWAAQQYLPSALQGKTFYTPSVIGYEGRIREEVLKKREIQAAVVFGDADADGFQGLTWSASSKGREGWFKRLESGRSALLLSDRDAILKACSPARHHRVLIAAANDGLLVWECLRRTPEGLCAALVDSAAAEEALLRYCAAMDEPEKPFFAALPEGKLPGPEEAEAAFSCKEFDHILAREPWRRGLSDPEEAFRNFAGQSRRLLSPQGDLVLLQSPPPLGERISRILKEECGAGKALADKLAAGEALFFSAWKENPENTGPSGRWTWNGEILERAFLEAGFQTDITIMEQKEERLLTERDLAAWFDKGHSAWGAFIARILGDGEFFKIRDLLGERIKQGPLTWKWKSLLLKGTLKNS